MSSSPASLEPPDDEARNDGDKKLDELKETLRQQIPPLSAVSLLSANVAPSASAGAGVGVVVAHRRKPSILANALSGALSAVLAEVVLFPVDTVKLLTQTAAAGDPSNFFSVFIRTLHERGLSGLYRGLRTHIFKESIHSFNYWVWHGFLFRHFTRAEDTSLTPTTHRLLINLIAKQLNWLCTVPFEVVASVNQLSANSPGFLAIAMQLYKEGGIGNFYRGLGISLVLAINPAIMNTLITTGLRLAAFVKMQLGADAEEARDHGPAVTGAATGVAKIIATLVTYPLIRAKVLQQTSSQLRSASPLVIWRHILAEEGPSGLYRGVLAMSYKTVLWNAFMMTVKNVIGPKRTATPQISPRNMGMPMLAMGRQPYVDEVAAQKLEEILEYIRRNRGQTTVANRVEALEARVSEFSTDLQAIKGMLHTLVQHQGQSSSTTPTTATATAMATESLSV
mmetsp:Transcript_10604/g.23150  ORF Transcript_10604/g.23150 Transcript_10604/m.23150 type:complete len:452 (-) Transcript_10604:351-1706(-)